MERSDNSPPRRYFDDEDLTLDLSLTIRAVVSEIDPAIKRIMDAVRATECLKGGESDVDLALREAVANAVIHGSREDPGKKVEIFVACAVETGLIIIVRDYGRGFDPHSVPNPVDDENIHSRGGRGVFLINELMDEVSYTKGGTEIHMRKR